MFEQYKPSPWKETFEIPKHIKDKLEELDRKEREFKRYYALAIMNGICPKCGNKLEGSGYKSDGLFSTSILKISVHRIKPVMT